MHDCGCTFLRKSMPFFIILKGGNNMKEIIENEVKIENIIYEIDGKEVMLDTEAAVIKCHRHYNKERSNQ